MVLKFVVKIAEEDEVSSLIRLACQLEISVTFRAEGTHLSGQVITDSVLVLLVGIVLVLELNLTVNRSLLNPV